MHEVQFLSVDIPATSYGLCVIQIKHLIFSFLEVDKRSSNSFLILLNSSELPNDLLIILINLTGLDFSLSFFLKT